MNWARHVGDVGDSIVASRPPDFVTSEPILPRSTTAVKVVSVSSWGAAGDVSTDHTVDIAAGATLDLANDMPAPAPDDGVGHAVRLCSSGLGRIFANALAWGCSPISTRAMLPSLSCQGFHRFVLAWDAGLREKYAVEFTIGDQVSRRVVIERDCKGARRSHYRS
jgi:hypothetical protein